MHSSPRSKLVGFCDANSPRLQLRFFSATAMPKNERKDIQYMYTVPLAISPLSLSELFQSIRTLWNFLPLPPPLLLAGIVRGRKFEKGLHLHLPPHNSFSLIPRCTYLLYTVQTVQHSRCHLHFRAKNKETIFFLHF